MMRPLVVDGAGVLLDVEPLNQTITGKKGGAVQYVIGGGKAPYFVNSSSLTIVPVLAASGDRFSVTVKNNTPAQIVTFTVTDSTTPTALSKQVTLTIV